MNKCIAYLLNAIIQSNCIPKSWRKDQIVAIFKGGDKLKDSQDSF